jgi:hypothetical protein
MEKITGTIATEPKVDNGKIKFLLQPTEENKKFISCLSAADFRGEQPKMNEKVAVFGEHKAEMIRGGDTLEFFFSSLQHLESQ